MDKRERVLMAINREVPDRVPTDFYAMNCVTEKLHTHYGSSNYKDLMDLLKIDVLDIRGVIDPEWKGPLPKIRANGRTRESYLGWRTKVVDTEFGEIEEHLDGLLEGASSLDEVDNLIWPQVDWFDFSSLKSRLDEYADYAVMASGASVYQHPAFNRGIENLLCDMLTFPDMAAKVMDKYVDFYLKYFSAMIEASGGRIDILRIADDLGMQDRILISPELFQQFIIPRINRFTDMAHSYGVKVMFHSCGNVMPFIDEIIKAGVDILDPIQTTASGMDPKTLKEKFGSRICLHGSIDTQYTLPKGNPESVSAEVREMSETLGRDGGFIIAPSHILQPDVPLENIVSMYDEIHRQNY